MLPGSQCISWVMRRVLGTEDGGGQELCANCLRARNLVPFASPHIKSSTAFHHLTVLATAVTVSKMKMEPSHTGFTIL